MITIVPTESASRHEASCVTPTLRSSSKLFPLGRSSKSSLQFTTPPEKFVKLMNPDLRMSRSMLSNATSLAKSAGVNLESANNNVSYQD